MLTPGVLGLNNTGARPVHWLVAFCDMVWLSRQNDDREVVTRTALAKRKSWLVTYFRRVRVSFLERKARVARRIQDVTSIKLGL